MAEPVASIGGAWHKHGDEVFPDCPKCLAEIADLKGSCQLLMDLLDEAYPEWRDELSEELAEQQAEQEGDE